MSVVKTVKAPEQFLVQMNGDYNPPFDQVEVTITAGAVAGTVLESATAVVDAESVAVFGILAEDVPAATATWVRVMTRGNPSTVNRQELVYGAATPATIDALLNAKGIVVVNV